MPSYVTYTIDYAADYYPYGKTLREFITGDGAEKFLTTQHERDQETGLDYRGARFYDSDIARFLSLDPLAADYPSLSDYSYVAGNPVVFVDPSGKSVERTYNVQMADGTTVQKEIDDGVDEIIDIQEQDFNQLQSLFNSAINQKNETGEDLLVNGQTIKDLTYYNSHFEKLALGTMGYQIALTARGYEGSLLWDYDVRKGNFPAGSYKCNKFVYDVIDENGAAPPGAWPPLASKWADPNSNIAGWTVVTDVKVGDVVAGAFPYSDATGHVVIVTGIDPVTGEITAIGTVASKIIGDNGYGNNLINNNGYHSGKQYTPVTIRRYTGN